jgi:hypothetical protein
VWGGFVPWLQFPLLVKYFQQSPASGHTLINSACDFRKAINAPRNL